MNGLVHVMVNFSERQDGYVAGLASVMAIEPVYRWNSKVNAGLYLGCDVCSYYSCFHADVYLDSKSMNTLHIY